MEEVEEIRETEAMHSEVSLLIGILLTLICRMEYSFLTGRINLLLRSVRCKFSYLLHLD